MYHIFLLIAPFFGVILAGFLFAKIKVAHTDWISSLNSYVVRIGFPSIIFYSLAKSPIHFSDHYQLFIVNSIYIIACFALAIIISRVFRLSMQMRRTLFICLPYGNVAYLGLPVLAEVFGSQIVPQTSIIVSIYLIWTFSVGIFYLEKTAKPNINYKSLILGLIKNPLLIGVFAGIIASFFRFPADGTFLKIFELISKSTTPVIMISLGIFISQVKFGKWKEWTSISLFTIVKIMVLPALFLFVLKAFKVEVNIPSIVEAAMPFALTPYALAGEYDLDKDFITKAVVLSTILSVLTLSFWLVVLG